MECLLDREAESSASSVTHWMQAFVVVGDNNGHVGLGVKCAKEVSPLLPSVQLQMS